MSLFQLFTILRARRGLAGLIVLSTIALALVWVLLRPPNFPARPPVLMDVRTDPVGVTSQYNPLVTPAFMSTQIDIVKSERVAERAVQLLPADQSPLSKWGQEAKKKPARDALPPQKTGAATGGKPGRREKHQKHPRAGGWPGRGGSGGQCLRA